VSQVLVVHKYGGSSVGTADKIQNVAKRIVKAKETFQNMVVVVSAMGKTTNQLVALSRELCSDPSAREMDMLLASGEQVSISLLAMAIHELGHKAISYNAAQIGFRTDMVHNKARIREIGTERIQKSLEEGSIVIIAGFQGINEHFDITTLGRGGSDLSAVALAVVLGAKACEIYTDVEGVYTADPRIVSNARKLDNISYEEMLELASMGAKVMHARSIEFAQKYDIPIHVRSSFLEVEGTWIRKEVKDMEDIVITGIALTKDEAKLTIVGVPDSSGMAAQIFTALAEGHINIDVIIQNVSLQGFTDISFTVPQEDLKGAMKISEQMIAELGAKELICKKDIAKLSIVGVGMRRHAGVAAKMFRCLADEKINIEMITTSEIKISCVIGEAEGEQAVKALHVVFELE
jgi:aspartate kinase